MSICGEKKTHSLLLQRTKYWVALTAFFVVTSGGCGRGGHIYSWCSLPVELQAAKTDNPRTIDLSKLATYSMSNELIDRGDVLNVAVSAGYGAEKIENMPVRVGDDGIANVPIIGRVPLAGIELQAAEQVVATAAIEPRFVSQSLGHRYDEPPSDE